jgi:tRNA pseudouridine55 synthase
MNNLHIINKSTGIGSTDVLNFIKHEYKKHTSQKLKIGHGGTLDPFAEGVLIVGIGTATKKLGNFLNCSKIYVANIQLGSYTDTDDIDGIQIFVSDTIPSRQQIVDILPQFQGNIQQIPPKYSAIHINGKRAYDLARQGIDFEMKSRTVTIHSLELLEYVYPLIKVQVKVSGGTYIRTLARDIGTKLTTGAFLKELLRTHVNECDITQSITKEELVQQLIQ